MIIELLLSLIVASTLIGIGVHFIPVGGAPAALSTSAGVPTGAPMITIGMGVTGIISAVSMINQPDHLMIMAGAAGSMLMIAVVMFFSNIIHVYGVGVPISSSNYEKDPVTKVKQDDYVSPGTTGHGIPTISFISGLIGSLLGGIGGSLAFTSLYRVFATQLHYSTITNATFSTILSLLLFFIVAVIASYNIGGTIQGFYDEKFRQKIIPGTISCFIVSIVLSVIYVFMIWGLIHG